MLFLNKNYNLIDEEERKRFLDLLIISKMKNLPFFSNFLVSIADFEHTDENKEESVAYTYFDHRFDRIKIAINFKKIEEGIILNKKNGNQLDSEGLYKLILHELLHHFLQHFSREKLVEYAREYPLLSNIVEDYFCDSIIKGIFNKSNEEETFFYHSYEWLNDIANDLCRKKLEFEHSNKPVEEKVIKFFLENISEEHKCAMSNWDSDFEFEVTDDHKTGNEKTAETLEEENKKRHAAGKAILSESNAEEKISAIINCMIESVLDSCKSAGKSESEAFRMLEMSRKKDPFLNFIKIKETLNKISSIYSSRTYNKTNRKRTDDYVLYKGKQKDEGKQIVVGVDVSGSVSDIELEKIYNLLDGFLSKNQEMSLDVIYWSSCKLGEKHHHRDVKDVKSLIKKKINTSYGTSVSTLFDYIVEKYRKPIVLLNITDGYYEYVNAPEHLLKQHYILLTTKETEEKIKKAYEKAVVKVCKIYE